MIKNLTFPDIYQYLSSFFTFTLSKLTKLEAERTHCSIIGLMMPSCNVCACLDKLIKSLQTY